MVRPSGSLLGVDLKSPGQMYQNNQHIETDSVSEKLKKVLVCIVDPGRWCADGIVCTCPIEQYLDKSVQA